jgi:hypothetical protein
MKLQIFFYLISILFLTSAVVDEAYSQFNPPLRLHGYIKEMPSIQFDKDFSNLTFGNLIHNRLNFRWDISSSMDIIIEGRNRLFYNENFKDFPQLKDIFEYDDGLVDMSWVWLSDGAWLGHTMIDRFYVGWRLSNWRVRLGRQRVNWGINLVSNPNDLFNVYSFFDFDYVERPGSDAIRIQHYFGFMSSVEIAVSPSEHSRDMVAAAKLGVNRWEYDFQAIAGYYRNRLALGGGWAGNLGQAGFKGEATWFYDLEETPGRQRGNVVAAAGLDYMFASGTFGVVEFLYNGGHARITEEAFLIIEPLRPDNIMFSEYAVTISANHPFSPIFSGGIAFMALPDIEALFFMPNIKYSVMTDLDFEAVSQIFIGGKGTIFESAGSAWYAVLQYSF